MLARAYLVAQNTRSLTLMSWAGPRLAMTPAISSSSCERSVGAPQSAFQFVRLRVAKASCQCLYSGVESMAIISPCERALEILIDRQYGPQGWILKEMPIVTVSCPRWARRAIR